MGDARPIPWVETIRPTSGSRSATTCWSTSTLPGGGGRRRRDPPGLPHPLRDDNGHDNSGLLVTTPGCRLLDGDQALARSRYYQYRGADGRWHADPGHDLGRIRRQQVLLRALAARALRLG